MTLILVNLGLTVLQQLLASFTAAKAPQEVIDAIKAAIVAVAAHRDDLLTKENFEAQRG